MNKKHLVNRIMRAVGFELVTFRSGATLETHLSEVLRKQGIELVIDVGANRGQFGALLRRIRYEGNIVSFEPLGDAFRKLEAVASRDPKWEAYRLGLSDGEEERDIHVFPDSVFSSLLKVSEFGKQRFSGLRDFRTERVELKTLETVLGGRPDLAGKRAFLKLDTQGFDLKVIRGAGRVLEQVFGLLSEISFSSIYEGMPRWHVAVTEYEKLGFSVSGVYPVSRDHDLSLIEADCVMVKRLR